MATKTKAAAPDASGRASANGVRAADAAGLRALQHTADADEERLVAAIERATSTPGALAAIGLFEVALAIRQQTRALALGARAIEIEIANLSTVLAPLSG